MDNVRQVVTVPGLAMPAPVLPLIDMGTGNVGGVLVPATFFEVALHISFVPDDVYPTVRRLDLKLTDSYCLL